MMNRVMFLMALVSATLVAHAGLEDAPTVFQLGKWKVLRNVDSMTDKASCTGIYDENYGVQLSKNALYLKPQGGVQGFSLRFGNSPANSMSRASDMERQLGVVVIDKKNFNRLLRSNRLRAEVLTFSGDLLGFDFDLRGINESLDYVRNRCAAEPASALAPQEASTCPDELRSKIRTAKLSAAQIAAVCGWN